MTEEQIPEGISAENAAQENATAPSPEASEAPKPESGYAPYEPYQPYQAYQPQPVQEEREDLFAEQDMRQPMQNSGYGYQQPRPLPPQQYAPNYYQEYQQPQYSNPYRGLYGGQPQYYNSQPNAGQQYRQPQQAMTPPPQYNGGVYDAPRPAEIPAMPQDPEIAEKKKSKAGFIVIAILSVLIVCGVMVMIALGSDGKESSSESGERITVNINVAPKPSSDPLDYQDESIGLYTTTGAVKHVLPSIVSLYGYSSTSITPSCRASGIIISDDGYIITNSHAVDDIKRVKVRLSDEKEYEAEIIGMDTRTDLAVLKIEAEGLVPAVIGSSGELEQGEQVIAIGNAGGFNNTVTVGYVSHPARELKSYTGYPVTYVQTDAAINFGNSGGPLINLYGQVVGIVNSKYSGTDGFENLGFAIASDFAAPICEDIIADGYVKGRPKIGIMYTLVTVERAQELDVEAGLLIGEIDEDCDIANTELRPDDIITEIDGIKMLTSENLKTFQNTHKAGDLVTAKVYRKSITGEVTQFEITFRLEEDK